MLGNTIVGLLILAALVGAYSGGWHRGKNGLKLWPFTAGKDGIHRQPLVLFALLLTGALVACSTEHYPSAKAPDTTAVRPDSDRHDGEHDRDHKKGKHHGHEDAAKP